MAFVQSTRYRLAWLLAGLFLVQLPFALLMPFHIDDPCFIHIARQVDRDPALPMNHPVIFEGRVYLNHMSYSHPPLACYYLWLLEKLSGGHFEKAAHLGFTVFFLLAAGSLFFLFRFAGLPPVFGTLLAAFAPALFVSSHTVMMDVPAFALGLAGAVSAMHGLRDGRGRLVWAGSALVGLAGLVSYVAAAHLLVPGVYAIASKRFWRYLPALALPAGLLIGGWLGVVFAATGQIPFLELGQMLGRYRAQERGLLDMRPVYNLVALGGGFFFPLALLARGWRTLRGKACLLLGFGLSAWLAVRFSDYGYSQQWVLGILAAAGLVLLVEGLSLAWQSARGRGPLTPPLGWTLAAWIAVFCCLGVMMFPHGAIRYQLWLVAPLGVALLASVAAAPNAVPGAGGLSRRKAWLALLVAGQVGLATTLAMADLDLARGLRRAAVEVFRSGEVRRAPGTVWVASDWGVRHYILEQGGRTILRYDRRPRPGDWFVRPDRLSPAYPSGYEQAPYGRLAGTVEVPGRFPVRVLDHAARAGFYSSWWGLLPGWPAEAGQPLEVLQVFRIERTLPPDPGGEKENEGFYRLPPGVEIPR